MTHMEQWKNGKKLVKMIEFFICLYCYFSLFTIDLLTKSFSEKKLNAKLFMNYPQSKIHL